MENGILVLFAQGATVAFLGKQDDWLPKTGISLMP